VVTTCPWTLQVKLVDGRTRLEARNGDKVQLQLTCERLNMQAPNGSIQAQGNVQVTGLDLKGTCDLLTISWQNDSVVLSGQVHLDGRDIELTAERLVLKPNAVNSAKSAAASEGPWGMGGWGPFR
jgi:hypothetical protein